MVYIRAQEGPANIGEKTPTVQYFDEQGNMIIRSGGTRAWRNNNPGNMVANHYTMGAERSSKAVGKAGGFAVYPDYKTGHQALVDMLSGKKWGAKTLQQASIDYTPDNPKHIDTVVDETGFDRTRKIQSLDLLEFEKYWKAIEKIEKWVVGKEEAIRLANEHRIHAILVHSPNGHLYLRPEYKGKRFRDLVC
ncbi:MAG TPA: hypothetical protein VGO47_07020 [Chlamydiales bacterium]|nr:hypothetical protein [Chlamydiales bacterium]